MNEPKTPPTEIDQQPGDGPLPFLEELGDANKPFTLVTGTFPIEFPQIGTTLDGEVEAIYDRCWPKLHVSIPSPAAGLPMRAREAVVTIDGTRVACLIATYKDVLSQESKRLLRAVLIPFGPANDFGDGNALSRVTFAIANFVAYFGDFLEGPQGSGWAGRLALEAAGWKVTLDQRQDLRELVEILDIDGGVALTHAGRIERSDASTFSIDQADDALDALYLLLSFARGRNVSIVLHRGEGATGERKWWRWLNAAVDRWSTSHTWFDSQRPEQMAAMYIKLLTRWHDEGWRKPLQLGVYWYKLAQQNASTSEAAIVLAFTGLELLSWFHLVELAQSYSSSKLNGEDAAQKLRLFLTDIKVDVSIPPTLPDLTAYAATMGWADGPACVATLRNAAVHPKRRGKVFGAPDKAIWDACSLALWYLELGLLALLGHEGTYINRTADRSTHQLEYVPWASPTEEDFA